MLACLMSLQLCCYPEIKSNLKMVDMFLAFPEFLAFNSVKILMVELCCLAFPEVTTFS